MKQLFRSQFIGFLIIGFGLTGCTKTQTPPKPAPAPRKTATPAPLVRQTLPVKPFPGKPKPAKPLPGKPLKIGALQEAEIVSGIVTKQKVFALTFDDGPHPTYTPQVLGILKQYKVSATFFMVGSMVRAHPQTAKLVVQAGQTIGNHSWSHPSKPKAPVAEVQRTDLIIQRVLGVHPTLFRPPYGILNNGMCAAAQHNNETVVIWNSWGGDWDKKATAQTIAANVLKRAKPGGIALLHDGGGDRTQTLAALPTIINALRKRGYTLVSVPELLKMGPPIPRPKPKPKPKAPAKKVSPQRPKVPKAAPSKKT